MTRKHFVSLATAVRTMETATVTEVDLENPGAIKDSHRLVRLEEVIDGLVFFLRQTAGNANFNEQAFRNACLPLTTADHKKGAK